MSGCSYHGATPRSLGWNVKHMSTVAVFRYRYLAGQKEYEVELQFTSALTGYPDRVKTGWEENKDGEEPVPGSVSDIGSDGRGTG